MGGQIIDASIVAAPKQRNTDGEKDEIKAGRIPEAWKDQPAKLAQKDRDARWTVKFSKAKPSDDGSPRIDLAVPAFGYKNHIGIDRRHGYECRPPRWRATGEPRATCGPIRPIARRRTKSSSPITAFARTSIARNRRAGPCR